ncbi:hypothetical protein ACWEO2_22740 [Nocardia sp. NPDC004278]
MVVRCGLVVCRGGRTLRISWVAWGAEVGWVGGALRAGGALRRSHAADQPGVLWAGGDRDAAAARSG